MAWLADRRQDPTPINIVALGAALGGRASNAEDITAAYVSPVMYQQYSPKRPKPFPREPGRSRALKITSEPK
jgi:hypothetical protein